MALQLPSDLGSAFLEETLFGWPGAKEGKWLKESSPIKQRRGIGRLVQEGVETIREFACELQLPNIMAL